MARRFLVSLAVSLACVSSCTRAPGAVDAVEEPTEPLRIDGDDVVRGITIGPIESALHPDVGYGSAAYARQLETCARMGATWVSLTPFGRVADLSGKGVDPTFETPFDLNFPRVLTAIRMAHARGLKVMLVPHLWIESGDWRALIDPGTDEAWEAWAASYEAFILAWARVAEAGQAEIFSAGAELRSWVTTGRAPSFARVLADVRREYRGLVTYSANWDDVVDTVILGDLDVIGINAFYPLADHEGATEAELLEGGERVRRRVHALGQTWHKPVLFTELGYTTRKNPAVRPWEWPDTMKGVVVDERAQADAYRALLAPLVDEPAFAGFFVWRVYSDPDDASQEAEWGFSPEGKQAELVVRDAFAARWVGEDRPWGKAARTPGILP
jgi:glycosyl hydrolase family 113